MISRLIFSSSTTSSRAPFMSRNLRETVAGDRALVRRGITRQHKANNGATLRAHFGPDTSAMIFDDLSADGKPQAGAARSGVGLAALDEFVEHRLELVCWNADALIGYGDLHRRRLSDGALWCKRDTDRCLSR